MSVLIVTADRPSSWSSCRAIASGLGAAWATLAGRREIHEVPLASEERATRKERLFALRRMAAVARERKPTHLVFRDESPNPGEALLVLRQLGLLPERVIVHTYGSFLRDCRHWAAAEAALAGIAVDWISASRRHSALVRALCVGGGHEVAPFPVETGLFQWSEEARARTRAKLGIAAGQKLLVYPGRISLQKGVERIAAVAELAAERFPGLRIAVAGGYDDHGAWHLGLCPPPGYQFVKIAARGWRNVEFLGEIPRTSLPGLYCAADVVMSLGLYHDEDFGMAAAEAALCGTPLLLSDWGGYADFAQTGTCALVPTRLGPSGLMQNTHEALELLTCQLKASEAPGRREASGKAAGRLFSPATAGQALDRVLARAAPPAFRGFTGLHREWTESLAAGRAVLPGTPLYGATYALYTGGAHHA